jgi:gamma-glutamyltranspeptidase/glutathione hydrolase
VAEPRGDLLAPDDRAGEHRVGGGEGVPGEERPGPVHAAEEPGEERVPRHREREAEEEGAAGRAPGLPQVGQRDPERVGEEDRDQRHLGEAAHDLRARGAAREAGDDADREEQHGRREDRALGPLRDEHRREERDGVDEEQDAHGRGPPARCGVGPPRAAPAAFAIGSRAMAPCPAALLAAALSVTAASPRGAVATAHPLASEAAAAVLRAGGNAADAAVAAAFALSVVESHSSGLGGGGFALYWDARAEKAYALDFREVAPAAARADMFLLDGKPQPRRSLDGGLAVAVPGAVRGYAELARRFGTRPLAELVAPAAAVAERGFRVGRGYAEAAARRRECLAGDPAAAGEFLRRGEDGRLAPLPVGARLVRRDLARTLRLIGRRGPDAFYRGPLAEKIAAAVRARGGVLTADDLARYATRERTPLEGSYRGRRVVSFPPPSSGGAIVIALLQALEGEDPRAGGYRPERWLHAQIELEKRLYARRAALFADPAFAPGLAAEVKALLSPEAARALRAQVGARATPAADLGAGRAAVAPEAPHTTHVSVVDGEGNAVALTTTVNYFFGACVVVPGTGILLNDEMDDFEVAPGVPNAYGLVGTGLNVPAPGKIPLSSMAPTFLLDAQGRLELVVGSPGGSTIPTTVAQVISHWVDDGMRLDEALGAPRLHHQYLPDVVMVEPNGLEAATAAALAARGHALEVAKRPIGNAMAVRIDWETGSREAASDPRFEGVAAVP